VTFGDTVTGFDQTLSITTFTGFVNNFLIDLCAAAVTSCTGSLSINAPSITGGGGMETGTLSLTSITDIVQPVTINTDNLFVGAPGTGVHLWVMNGSVASPPPTKLNPSDLGVNVGGIDLLTNSNQNAGNAAIAGAAAAAVATAADTAANAFSTDSVAEIIEFGFAGDIGTLPPMDHRLTGVGISVPSCFNESREGEECSR